MSNILEEANEVVGVERMAEHGHPSDNLSRTADLWTAILDTRVSADQVALCMIAHKIARTCAPGEHRDNLVDIAGYARVIEMLWEDRAGA